MRYGTGQFNPFIDGKQQLRFDLELAVVDHGKIMEREQVETFPDHQTENRDSEGSS